MKNVTCSYGQPPQAMVRCAHCDKISVYPLDIRSPFYSYRDEAEYWRKRYYVSMRQMNNIMKTMKENPA